MERVARRNSRRACGVRIAPAGSCAFRPEDGACGASAYLAYPIANRANRVERKLITCPESAHLEVETYTWSVLPAQVREVPIEDAIARELLWVRGELA